MANEFTARVAGISVELGMSVQNKSGIWCKPTVKMDLKIDGGTNPQQREAIIKQAFDEVCDNIEKTISEMKCYASDYCQKDKSSCSDVCGGYRVLRALYNLSRIPERYRYTIALKPENGEDLEAFTTLDNYKNDVLSMVDEGRGLYIWGKSTGNGKTSWACKIMSYFFRKIAFNTGLENEGLYIFLPTFLEDLRDNYDNKDPEFDEVLRMIKTCRLLIIDDIGAERVTDWVRERMVSIINTRVSNNLTTIYTSNLSPEELRGELGDRIASRVLGSSQVVEITSGDRRGL